MLFSLLCYLSQVSQDLQLKTFLNQKQTSGGSRGQLVVLQSVSTVVSVHQASWSNHLSAFQRKTFFLKYGFSPSIEIWSAFPSPSSLNTASLVDTKISFSSSHRQGAFSAWLPSLDFDLLTHCSLCRGNGTLLLLSGPVHSVALVVENIWCFYLICKSTCQAQTTGK